MTPVDSNTRSDSVGWRSIESCPQEDLFIGAVFVINNRTGASWWERHLLALDDETGDIHADYDQGWQLADYAYWHPLDLPPLPSRPTPPALDERRG